MCSEKDHDLAMTHPSSCPVVIIMSYSNHMQILVWFRHMLIAIVLYYIILMYCSNIQRKKHHNVFTVLQLIKCVHIFFRGIEMLFILLFLPDLALCKPRTWECRRGDSQVPELWHHHSGQRKAAWRCVQGQPLFTKTEGIRYGLR